jgi:hypothetical protein
LRASSRSGGNAQIRPDRKSAIPVFPSAFLPFFQLVTLSIFRLEIADLFSDQIWPLLGDQHVLSVVCAARATFGGIAKGRP